MTPVVAMLMGRGRRGPALARIRTPPDEVGVAAPPSVLIALGDRWWWTLKPISRKNTEISKPVRSYCLSYWTHSFEKGRGGYSGYPRGSNLKTKQMLFSQKSLQFLDNKYGVRKHLKRDTHKVKKFENTVQYWVKFLKCFGFRKNFFIVVHD